MEAIAYRIIEESTDLVILEGIVRYTDDNIYPAQDAAYLKTDYPELPFEVEVGKFSVKGLRLETIRFELEWKDVLVIKSQTFVS